MPSISTVDARNNFSDTINRVFYAGERIIVERRGKAIAVLIPVGDFEILKWLDLPENTELKATLLDDTAKGIG